MTEFTYEAVDDTDTEALGTALAGILPTGTTIALNGTLGAGKTRLVQAIAAASGVAREDVASPTFVMVHEYTSGRRPIYHFDAYRIKDDDEFLQLGPDEYFEGDGLTLVEWAARVERCLPAERLEIEIEITGETSRRFCIRPVGQHLAPFTEEIKQRLSGRHE